MDEEGMRKRCFLDYKEAKRSIRKKLEDKLIALCLTHQQKQNRFLTKPEERRMELLMNVHEISQLSVALRGEAQRRKKM